MPSGTVYNDGRKDLKDMVFFYLFLPFFILMLLGLVMAWLAF